MEKKTKNAFTLMKKKQPCYFLNGSSNRDGNGDKNVIIS